MMTRRGALATVAAAIGCARRKKEKGFAGYAFVANSGGGAVAAVDLTAFAVVKHIRVDGNPTQVASWDDTGPVMVLSPDTGALSLIDPDGLKVLRQTRIEVGMAPLFLEPGGKRIWTLSPKHEVLVINAERLQLDRRVALPHTATSLDFGPSGTPVEPLAALSLGDSGDVVLVNRGNGKVERTIHVGGIAGPVKFRRDGRYLLVANRSQREMALVDLHHNRMAVRLPLALQPDRCAMKGDGGQLFVTGEGMDAVVTVYPYKSEVGSITLAGRAPGFLAASESPDYLFVANPASNDVTVINVATQKVMAVASVGKEPYHIAVTPNAEYALVLNRQSGDMSVLHIGSMTARRQKSIPLLTMVPVGSAPVSAVIRSI